MWLSICPKAGEQKLSKPAGLIDNVNLKNNLISFSLRQSVGDRTMSALSAVPSSLNVSLNASQNNAVREINSRAAREFVRGSGWLCCQIFSLEIFFG